MTPSNRQQHRDLTATLSAQRRAIMVEPIHNKPAPVRAYVGHIAKLKGTPYHVVTIPEGSAAFKMGYRFVSVPGDELAYYLANGATEVIAP